jgi:hypothetical protein
LGGADQPHPFLFWICLIFFLKEINIFLKHSKNKNDQSRNLLTLVPVHTIKWHETDDGKIDLLTPKIKNDKIRRLFKKSDQPDYYSIHLDEIGSSVWKLIDGQTTVAQIAKDIHEKFGDKIEPVFERLGEFIRQLHQKQFIAFKNYD